MHGHLNVQYSFPLSFLMFAVTGQRKFLLKAVILFLARLCVHTLQRAIAKASGN